MLSYGARHAWWGMAGVSVSLAAAFARAPGPLFLADDTRTPHVKISWQTADGQGRTVESDIAYGAPVDRIPMGDNFGVYVALGGVRLENGAGNPEGAIVRIGLAKLDNVRMLIADIAVGSDITIQLTNVAFTQPATPVLDTTLQQLLYKADDILICGLSLDQTRMYNLLSSTDTLSGTLQESQIRHGSLDGDAPGDASVELRSEPDGSISMLATLPYALLRHKSDPWRLEVPGTFFEPVETHIEFEVLPVPVAESLGLPTN